MNNRERRKIPAHVRCEIQRSAESALTLAKRYGINPKSVFKWRARCDPSDAPLGRSAMLSTQEEAILVSFRNFTRLPLDDVLYAMQLLMPQLKRSTLHNCLRKYGASVAPAAAMTAPPTMIGSFRINVSETMTLEGRRFIFVGVDPESKLYFASAFERAGSEPFEQFLDELCAYVPYQIHGVTMQKSTAGLLQDDALAPDDEAQRPLRVACRRRGAGLSLINTIVPEKLIEARTRTAQQLYVRHARELETMISDFLRNYNFARRLKAIGGRTPFRNICAMWDAHPGLFARNPHHHFLD